MSARTAEATEVGRLARIWFDGWQDAHAKIVPAELGRRRTVKVISRLDTEEGEFPLEVWRYEKDLS